MSKLRLKKIVGLDIDEGSINATEISAARGRLRASSLFQAAALEELAERPELKNSSVAITLPAHAVLLRIFQVSASILHSRNKDKDIMAFLQRQNLPFKLEECFWGVFIWQNNLHFVAARKEAVQKQIAVVEAAGFRCVAVIPSFLALYYILVQNNPQAGKDRFVIVHVRKAASDLIICEDSRLSVYPLSLGQQQIAADPQQSTKFSQELSRIHNSHRMQHAALSPAALQVFVSGREISADFIVQLQKNFTDTQVVVLDPFKKITAAAPAGSASVYSLSAGLAAAYLGSGAAPAVNFIRDRIRRENRLVQVGITRKLVTLGAVAACVFLLLGDLLLAGRLQREQAAYARLTIQVDKILPSVKGLLREKESLISQIAYLQRQMAGQQLYLQALALISRHKPAGVVIKEFDSKLNDSLLEVVITGASAGYEQVNVFLSGLKKEPGVHEPKVVASTFPGGQAAGSDIDFKLRFEVKKEL